MFYAVFPCISAKVLGKHTPDSTERAPIESIVNVSGAMGGRRLADLIRLCNA